MIEVEKLVSNGDENLFARVAREHIRAKAQSVGLTFIVLHSANGAIKAEHAQPDVKVALLVVLVEARLKENDRLDKRTCGNIGNGPVELANGFDLTRHSNQELIQHRATDIRVCCSVDRSIEVVPMLVLNQTLPQSSLGARRLVLRLVPEDQEVVDNVYDVLIIEESFENGLIRKGFGLSKRRLREE